MSPELRTAEPELLEHELLGAPAELTRPAPPPSRSRSSRRAWLIVLVGAVAWSLVRAGVGRGEVVNSGGWSMVRRFLAAAVQPELGAEFLRVAWSAGLTTVSYAVVGTALSIAIGVVFGVLASETWWGRASSPGRRRAWGGWVAARGMLSLPRGVHEAVWGLFLARVLGLDPLVGVLAIALPYGAVTAKVYAELLDETPDRAFRAVRGAGAGRLKALCYTTAPAALADMVSYAFYRLECSIRAAAILGIIGAGGLGFQLALSLESLRYDEVWTLLYALVLLSGATDAWSAAVRRRTRHPEPVTPSRHGRPRRDRFLVGSAVALAGLVVAGVWHLGLAPARLVAARARSLLADIASSAWPPDLDAGTLAALARASLETIEMSVLATAIAGTAAALVALCAGRPSSRRFAGRLAATALRALLLVCRAIPPPVWALLFVFVLFPGPLPGALALAAYNFGILGRLMGEVVENGDDRPAAALRAQGASPAAVVVYGVAPAVLPRFVSYAVYRWEVTLRETVVVGLVGAGGLGRLLRAQLAAFDYPGVLTTLVALVALTFLGDVVGAALRRSLR